MKGMEKGFETPAAAQPESSVSDPKIRERSRLERVATSPAATYLALAAIALSTEGCGVFKSVARHGLPVLTLEGGRPGKLGLGLAQGGQNVGFKMEQEPFEQGALEWWRKPEGVYLTPVRMERLTQKKAAARAAQTRLKELADAGPEQGTDIFEAIKEAKEHDYAVSEPPRRTQIHFDEGERWPADSVVYSRVRVGERFHDFAQRAMELLTPALADDTGVSVEWHMELQQSPPLHTSAGQAASQMQTLRVMEALRRSKGYTSGLNPHGAFLPGLKSPRRSLSMAQAEPPKSKVGPFADTSMRLREQSLSLLLDAGLQKVSGEMSARFSPLSTPNLPPETPSRLEDIARRLAFSLPDEALQESETEVVAVKRIVLPSLVRTAQIEKEWNAYQTEIEKGSGDQYELDALRATKWPHLALYLIERGNQIARAKREAVSMIFPALMSSAGIGAMRFHVMLNPDKTEMIVIGAADKPRLPVQEKPSAYSF